MIRMHSMTFEALRSKAVRAIRFMRTEHGPMRNFLHDQEIIVDDREPRNELVELACLAIQENP